MILGNNQVYLFLKQVANERTPPKYFESVRISKNKNLQLISYEKNIFCLIKFKLLRGEEKKIMSILNKP